MPCVIIVDSKATTGPCDFRAARMFGFISMSELRMYLELNKIKL